MFFLDRYSILEKVPWKHKTLALAEKFIMTQDGVFGLEQTKGTYLVASARKHMHKSGVCDVITR